MLVVAGADRAPHAAARDRGRRVLPPPGRRIARETRHLWPLPAVLLALALPFGCGGDDRVADTATPTQPPPETRSNETGHSPPLHAPRCPPSLANCRAATGRIVYIERVDPDGDGDAHFVLASEQSITAPGITVIDVERGLRPHPLPGVGAEVGAAGPVYRGSYGQRQIEAVELSLAR